MCGALCLAASGTALAQDAPGGALGTVTCSSQAGERRVCPADTSAGVVLVRSIGTGACLLGKTWGYDQTSVWVSDGCGGEFMVGPTAAGQAAVPAPTKPPERIETWGEFDPGEGFLVGRSSAGELSISAYGLLRYLNQTPGIRRSRITSVTSGRSTAGTTSSRTA